MATAVRTTQTTIVPVTNFSAKTQFTALKFKIIAESHVKSVNYKNVTRKIVNSAATKILQEKPLACVLKAMKLMKMIIQTV